MSHNQCNAYTYKGIEKRRSTILRQVTTTTDLSCSCNFLNTTHRFHHTPHHILLLWYELLHHKYHSVLWFRPILRCMICSGFDMHECTMQSVVNSLREAFCALVDFLNPMRRSSTPRLRHDLLQQIPNDQVACASFSPKDGMHKH